MGGFLVHPTTNDPSNHSGGIWEPMIGEDRQFVIDVPVEFEE